MVRQAHHDNCHPEPALDCDRGSGNDATREIFTHKFVADTIRFLNPVSSENPLAPESTPWHNGDMDLRRHNKKSGGVTYLPVPACAASAADRLWQTGETWTLVEFDMMSFL